ncbi:MAG TPA: hypothetical protein VFA11_14250 [Acidimicrobiales bacterium]|nr:hypothetical protein [Acidimicrobiales bacterium]
MTGEEVEIFTTPDEERARSSLGQVYLLGAVPYRATLVEPVTRTEWAVKGVRQDPHPDPSGHGG